MKRSDDKLPAGTYRCSEIQFPGTSHAYRCGRLTTHASGYCESCISAMRKECAK